jgi:hypothetical protein
LNDWRTNALQSPASAPWKPRPALALRVALTCLIISLSWPLGASNQPDFENWYQIEILVFRQRDEVFSDESWPLAPRTYPSGMLAVGPGDDGEITPDRLSQALQLLQSDLPSAQGSGSNGNTDGSETMGDGTTGTPPTFLFEDLSRQKLQHALLNQPSGEMEVAETQEEETLDEAILDSLLYGPRPDAYRALDASDQQLGSIARSLGRSSKFELLSHLAWRQPVGAEATPILVQLGQHYGDDHEIDGILSFSRTRFLHIAADLWYTQFTARFEQQPLPQQNEPSAARDLAQRYPELVEANRLGETYMPVHRYHLLQSRRMRSGELHYIDHPFFGILVQITPFEYQSALQELSSSEQSSSEQSSSEP